MSHRRQTRRSRAAAANTGGDRPPARPPAPVRWIDVAIGAVLVVATLLVYAQVRTHGFLTHDDPEYVTANAHVLSGLTASGAAWALGTTHDANWFPLTWLSHMADVQAFGLDAGAHHLVSVGLHLLTAILLFASLRRMTGARWPAALAACLFALHPLRVESVAWVAERKDVLSGFFWMLTLLAYAGYVGRPSRRRYLLVLAAFGLGLMSKSMIVTLPFVLLLVDWWPLARWDPTSGRRPALASLAPLVREKLPLLALSAVVSAVTFAAQRSAGAVAAIDTVPLSERLANAVVSYVVYLRDMVWPTRLAVFYPLRPVGVPAVLAATVVLVGLSALAVRAARRRPYLAVGWFWYLGTLVPVIGLIQVGSQSRADRYTYIPSIGVALALAWALAELVGRRPRLKPVVAGIAVAALAGLALSTWRLLPFWQTSDALFEHAMAVTGENYVAEFNLGLVRRSEGRLGEALEHYQRAAAIRPAYAEAQNNIAEILIALGRAPEALPHLSEALRTRPDLLDARVNRGVASAAPGRLDAAESAFREALRLAPDNPQALAGLGDALAREGRPSEALAELAAAVRLQPDNAQLHYNLGSLLASGDRMSEAAGEFAAAVRLEPDDVRSRVNLGSALAALGRYDEAIAQFTEALRLDPGLEAARRNLEQARALQAEAPKR